MAFFLAPNLELPWSSSVLDDERFIKILRNFFIALVILSLLITFIPVRELERAEKEKLPPQLARVVLEKKELPPPPPPKPKEKPKPEEKKTGA